MPSEPAFWGLPPSPLICKTRMKNGNTWPWCVNWCRASGKEPAFGTTAWQPKSMVMTNSTWSVETAALSLEITVISIRKELLVRYLLKENAFERTKYWEVLECGDLFIMFVFYILYTHKILETGSKVKKVSVRPSTVLHYLWMSLLLCKIWSYFWRLFENLPYNLHFQVTITSNVWMLITLDEWLCLGPLSFLPLPHIPPLILLG